MYNRNKRKYEYGYVKEFIESKNCELLSKTYLNTEDKLEIKFECGHIGTRNFYNFQKGKTFLCAKCAGAIRNTIDDVVGMLNGTKFKYISGEYLSNESKLTIQDKDGYKYYTSFTLIKIAIRNIKKGSKNNGLLRFDESNLYTIENMKLFLKNENMPFNFIDGEFINAHKTNLIFECHNCENKWNANWNNIKNGKECPACAMSKGEKKISKFLENNLKITKYQPQYSFSDLFRNKKSRLRFDFGIWVKDKFYLCEFHGKFHYEEVEFFGGLESFKDVQLRDKIKEDYCRKNNINLIVIPYWEKKNIESILTYELGL